MATLRTVTKNTLLYTFSSVLQRSSSIIFFPIFSFYLTKGDYGIQSIVYFVTQFITILCGLELPRTATRLIHEGEDFEARARKIYGSYLVTIVTMNVVVSSLLMITGPWLMRPFLNDIPFYPYMALTLCTLPLVATYGLYKNYLQATHQGSRFVKMDFLYFLCNIGFNLLFVIVYGMGAAGIILSTVISAFVFSVYAYFAFFRFTRLRFDKSIMREALRFSLPLIPFILIGVLMEWSDKIILNAKVGKDAGGILYIATMIAAFFTVLRESCNQALIPWFYQQYGKLPEAYVHRVVYAAFGGLAILAVSLSWFTYELLFMLSSNPELVRAYRYAPLIVNTALVVFLSQIFNTTVMYFRTNTRYLFLTSLIGLAVNLSMSVVLINFFSARFDDGIYGAAASNFLAMLFMTITSGVLSHRSGFKMNYLYFVIVIVGSMSLSLLALLPLPFWAMFATKALIAAAMVLTFYMYLAKHFPVQDLILERLRPLLALVQRARD